MHGGHEHALRQTLIALTAGSGLAEHNSPGEATLQVLCGRVRLTAAGDSVEAEAGEAAAQPRRQNPGPQPASQISVSKLSIVRSCLS